MKKPNGSYTSKRNKSKGKPHIFYLKNEFCFVYESADIRRDKHCEKFCEHMDLKL